MTNEEVIEEIRNIEGIACPIHGIGSITISDGDGNPSNWIDFCTECAEEENDNEPPELIPAREYIEKLFLQALQDKDEEWRGKVIRCIDELNSLIKPSDILDGKRPELYVKGVVVSRDILEQVLK